MLIGVVGVDVTVCWGSVSRVLVIVTEGVLVQQGFVFVGVGVCVTIVGVRLVINFHRCYSHMFQLEKYKFIGNFHNNRIVQK